MEKQILKGLTITYDKSEEEKVNAISEVIQRHQFIFDGLFDDENNNTMIDVNDFNNLVNQVVAKYVAAIEPFKTEFESEDFLLSNYLGYLILKYNQGNHPNMQYDSDVTVEQVLFALSIKYYNYDVEKISQALLSEYTEMVNHLKEEQRINLYNYILRWLLKQLEETDRSMIEQLGPMLLESVKRNAEYGKYLRSHNSELDNLKELSKEELDKLFIDFLSYINAPQKWVELYNEARQNNLITFEYSKEMYNGACYFDETDNKRKIKVISNGTIRAFITFVHEFMHYVVGMQNDKTPLSLLEFPSIYYENIAGEFLQSVGYGEGIIDDILTMRYSDNLRKSDSNFRLLTDILSIKKSGLISLEAKKAIHKSGIEARNIIKIRRAEEYKSRGDEVPEYLLTLENPDEKTVDEMTYSEIDDFINKFVIAKSEDDIPLLKSTSYLVGSLLAFEILENTDRKHSNEMMIDVTNQLDNHSMASIMQLFGINLSSEPEPKIIR